MARLPIEPVRTLTRVLRLRRPPKRDDVQQLLDLSEKLPGMPDIAEILASPSLLAASTGPLRFASFLHEKTPDGDSLLLAASGGLPADVRAALARLAVEGTGCGRALRSGATILFTRADASAEPVPPDIAALGDGAAAAFPLVAASSVIGVLAFAAPGLARFPEADLRLMATATAIVAAAVRRARIEQSGRLDDARLRLALDRAAMGAWSWNPATRVLHHDGQVLRLHGLDPVEARPNDLAALLDRIEPADRAKLRDARRRSEAADEPLHCDYRVRLPGGELRRLAIHAVPVRDGAGAVLAIAGLVEDVSEPLGSGKDPVARLAGGVAHDFNNVLQAIEGSASLVAGSIGSGDSEAAQRFLAIATKACERGAAVTSRLLAFGGRSVLHPEAVDVAGLLEEFAARVRPTIGAAIAITLRVAPGLPPLSADRERLMQTLVGLAENARDAMENGGTLLLTAERSETGERAAIRLVLADSGTGMTPEILARASEPFFSTKGAARNTGLGLAAARGFAEQSGGTFAIESAPRRGTTVSIVLPEAAAVPRPRLVHPTTGFAERPAAWPDRTGETNVLLVEPDGAVRAVLLAELSHAGLQVAALRDVASAAAMLEGGDRPAVLLADAGPPGHPLALPLARTVRERLPRLPVLVLAGHDATDFPDPADGPVIVLRKPVGGEALRRTVAGLLAADA